MKKYLDVLKKCSLFEGIAPDDLDRMLHCLSAKVDFFDKKVTVLSEGSSAKYIGIVLSGGVQVSSVDYYGNRSILSGVGSGGVFAEEFACSASEALPVSVIASEPSNIMFIECGCIMHTCKNNCGFHQRLIYNLMRGLAGKSIAFHRRIEITSKRSTRDKLMAYLAICAKDAGSSSFDIDFDRQELADYLEVERSGLSAEISKLRAEGVIACTKNHFELI